MIDAEVLRLRRLRDIALRTRALGRFLDSDSAVEHSLFAKSALLCWTVARIAAGRLRAHPYLSYQQGPSRLRAITDRVCSSLLALSARRSDRAFSIYSERLQVLAREVDDVRALTWSPDLSDALGRMQIQMRRLASEFGMSARIEAGIAVPRTATAAGAEPSNALGDLAVESNWPYLAIQR
jgi:hypothetical protein